MSEVYTIEHIKELDSKLIAAIKLDVNHKVFDGHFPQQSVLPGVLQLTIIKAVVSQYLGKNFRIKSVKNAKYLSMILPENDSKFNVEIDFKIQDDQSIKVKSVIKNEQKVFLKYSGEFIAENE
jgi:3-hydroxyacyl-[acyl-carrier-protein] dehydratase